MQAAADQWLESTEASALILTLPSLPEWGKNQTARDVLRGVYIAGYQDGRKRDDKPGPG